MPSLFSLTSTPDLFQAWFVVYLYLLPVVLYMGWTALAYLDLASRKEPSVGWAISVILLPILGAGAYLIATSDTRNRTARYAIVGTGLLIWVLLLAAGIWLAGGPLGPKAL